MVAARGDDRRRPRRPIKTPAAAESNPRPPNPPLTRSLCLLPETLPRRHPRSAAVPRRPELRKEAQQLCLVMLVLLVYTRQQWGAEINGVDLFFPDSTEDRQRRFAAVRPPPASPSPP
jgi:hypothetical protein